MFDSLFEFYSMNEKTEKLTDEELNTVTGGAQPLYVSQPCEVPGRGMAVYVMPVSGQSSYDPVSKKFSMSSMVGGKTIAYDRLGEYHDRMISRGYSIVNINIAGPFS